MSSNFRSTFTFRTTTILHRIFFLNNKATKEWESERRNEDWKNNTGEIRKLSWHFNSDVFRVSPLILDKQLVFTFVEKTVSCILSMALGSAYARQVLYYWALAAQQLSEKEGAGVLALPYFQAANSNLKQVTLLTCSLSLLIVPVIAITFGQWYLLFIYI